jgi:Transposase DDE domain
MFQSTQRRISEKIKSTLDSDALPFHEILDADMVKSAVNAEGVQFNDRIYTPFVTLCLFLSQVLDQDHSCRAAVSRLILWMVLQGREPCSADTTSYCDARVRLPLKIIVRLVHQIAENIEAGASDEWLWKGRRVSLADGSTASMPDTPRNQRAFPQSSSQGVGLGFPLVRFVVLISLATGVVRDLALGPHMGKETGETALFRALLDRLTAGEIVLGDRYFGSFFLFADLMRRNVDGLFRMHQCRKFDFRRGRRLGVADHIVTWSKPARPQWMDEETYAQVPDEITVRELRFQVEQPGFRVNEVVLATTMLDAAEYTKEELADLFLQRWGVELDLRAIKDVLQMDVLRCKSPEMVEKEIWMHLLAYNLIRGVMAQAAEAHEKRPRLLSFKGTLQTITAFQEALRRAAPVDRELLLQAMLRAIAQHEVGHRFGRVEPRLNKRRPKGKHFLTEPRCQARKRLLDAA